jgi:hypothetical protein
MLKDGKPVPADVVSPEYQEWYNDIDNRRVARTEIAKDIWVSTVFLGLDHNLFGAGDPVLWETMIFGGSEDMHQERATNQEEALEHHKEAVVLAKKGLEDNLIRTRRKIDVEC